MTLSQFENLELAVGKGENHFTMSRGSFVYKQKFAWKRQLKLTGKTEVDTKKYTLLSNSSFLLTTKDVNYLSYNASYKKTNKKPLL